MSAFKFNTKPGPPPHAIARKCIVCGTTKHECHMKPFLLKGDQLSAWTNNYFSQKRTKLFNFYAKLRYTINPYACTEHFNVGPAPQTPTKSLAKVGLRNCFQLLKEGEEPPSIKKITEKKPSPPPEEPKEQKDEDEVKDTVMAILKAAREEMDKQEQEMREKRKKYRDGVDMGMADMEGVKRRRKKKKQQRKEREAKEKEKREKQAADGNEADSDNSMTIDVEAVDDSGDAKSSSGSDGSSYEDSDTDLESLPPTVAQLRQQQRQRAAAASSAAAAVMFGKMHPPPMVVVPRRPISMHRPYRIAAPLEDNSKQPLRSPTVLIPSQVPKRLTLGSGSTIGSKYQRPSWVSPNPGQHTLASVLQRFWNEDTPPNGPPQPIGRPGRHRTVPFGTALLPGTKTKFKPAALASPSLFNGIQNESPPKSRLHVRHSALMNCPPLSPSRIIIGGEETVVTTQDSDAESKETEFSSSSSSSSCSSDESDIEVEVCDNSCVGRPPVEGPKIEGVVLDEMSVRSRSISTALSTSSEDLEKVTSSEDEEEESEVDVETLSVSDKNGGKAEKKGKEREKRTEKEATPTPASTSAVEQPPPIVIQPKTRETDRRKQRMPSAATTAARTKTFYRALAGKIIQPPSALVKPPTKLLSSGQLSMKELLHAQARAAAVQPVRIDTAGLVYGLKRTPGLRPKGMPRLQVQTRGESEWARLERVVEKKMAEKRARAEAEKKRKQLNLVDPVLMTENPPPELERVDTEDDDESPASTAAKIKMIDGFPVGLVETLAKGMEGRKVLRMTFKEKKEDMDVSKLKVLDRPQRPLGVEREEEVVTTCAIERIDAPLSPPVIDKMGVVTKAMVEKKKTKKEIFGRSESFVKEVRHPSLIINKDELMEIKERLNVPPPVPVVNVPDERAFAARRELFDKKRNETLIRAGLRFGLQQRKRDEWARKQMNGMMKGMRDVHLEEQDMEEAALMAESMDIIRMVKAERMNTARREFEQQMEERRRRAEEIEKLMEEEEKREERRGREEEKEQKEKKKKKEGVEDAILRFSDIENDDDDGNGDETMREDEGVEREDEEGEDTMREEEEGEEEDDEMEEEGEEIGEKKSDRKKDGDWKLKGARVKRREEDGESRRKSYRLKVKRELIPKSERRLIWKESDDEEEEEEGEENPTPEPPASNPPQEQQPTDESGKRKRGRPRKYPPKPPPKRKRACKKMTNEEKELLSRVLAPPPARGVDESSSDSEKETNSLTKLLRRVDAAMEAKERGVEMSEEGGKRTDDGMEADEGGVEMGREGDDDAMEELERQEPKAAGDEATTSKSAFRRAPEPYSWKLKLCADMAVTSEMGGRLCNYCMKNQKRYIWIPNEATALMDHARTHCVETLMCPSKDCTYMNTHRSRVSQHVSYVHKKWGMPIDLAAVYPSMRKTLMLRLVHCFPDLPNVAVCLLCRVAVRLDADEFRWHAQSHLERRVFECSRDICSLKFSTEQECRDHIKKANCHGSVVNGLTDEMEVEVTELMSKCFANKDLTVHEPDAKKPRVADDESDGGAHSSTPSASASKPTSQQMESGEKRGEKGKEDVRMEEKEDETEDKMEEGSNEKGDEMDKASTSH